MDLDGRHLMQTSIDLEFADGQYQFALGLAQINELQNKCGDGIGAIYARVLQGRVPENIGVGHPAYAAFRIADLVETVRQGLIGGGKGMVDGAEVEVGTMRANQLVSSYALQMPLARLWDLAAAVLYALFEGYEPARETAGGGEPSGDKKKETGSITPER